MKDGSGSSLPRRQGRFGATLRPDGGITDLATRLTCCLIARCHVEREMLDILICAQIHPGTGFGGEKPSKGGIGINRFGWVSVGIGLGEQRPLKHVMATHVELQLFDLDVRASRTDRQQGFKG
jgi:hypothetical protein